MCLSVCVCVSLSASISLEPLDQSSQNFLRKSPVAIARSSSGGFAVRYVLPILWMTSHLAIVGRMAMRGKRLCDTGAELDVYECLVRTRDCRNWLLICCKQFVSKMLFIFRLQHIIKFGSAVISTEKSFRQLCFDLK